MPRNLVLDPLEGHPVSSARRNVNLFISVGCFPADAHMSNVSSFDPIPSDDEEVESGMDGFESV